MVCDHRAAGGTDDTSRVVLYRRGVAGAGCSILLHQLPNLRRYRHVLPTGRPMYASFLRFIMVLSRHHPSGQHLTSHLDV